MDTNSSSPTMDDWLRMLKSTKPAPGHDRVFIPDCRKPKPKQEYKAMVFLCIAKWSRLVAQDLPGIPYAVLRLKNFSVSSRIR